MRNKKKLLIEQLDQKLKPFQKTEVVLVPDKGWINTIRTTLNMTMAQLGIKLNVTRQGVKKIEKAIEWIIHTNLKSEKILTEKFIRDLHKKMYDDVWKWAGVFRKSDKNIGVELKNLIDDTKYWLENKTYSPEEIAIRFKHRIVAINCFPNGNGRHSRMMADIIMESIFKKEIFTWHKSNMVKPDETRKNYIIALREADNGNINPLIEFAQN